VSGCLVEAPSPTASLCGFSVYASRQLLENGTVTPKASEASTTNPPGPPVGAAIDAPAIPHGDTELPVSTGRFRHRAQLPEREVSREGSSPIEGHAGGLRSGGGSEISMESLILAQDERWRRA
jgi:hypothetical protein